MRWQWFSLCHLLLLLSKRAIALEEEDEDDGGGSTIEDTFDSSSSPDPNTTSNASNEMGCEVRDIIPKKSLFFRSARTSWNTFVRLSVSASAKKIQITSRAL